MMRKQAQSTTCCFIYFLNVKRVLGHFKNKMFCIWPNGKCLRVTGTLAIKQCNQERREERRREESTLISCGEFI